MLRYFKVIFINGFHGFQKLALIKNRTRIYTFWPLFKVRPFYLFIMYRNNTTRSSNNVF